MYDHHLCCRVLIKMEDGNVVSFGSKNNKSCYENSLFSKLIQIALCNSNLDDYHTACLKTSLLNHLPFLNKVDLLINLKIY